MIPSAPPSRTASSNGTSVSSRSVRASITELMLWRSNSASLPAKCFTVVTTPCDCTPRTNAAAVLPESSGSSE